MRYQVRDISQVHTIDSREVSFDAAMQHFVKYGYEYLYIIQDNQIKDVISYHEFIKYGLDYRKRDYILESNDLNGINIEDYLEKHYSLNRLVVLKDGKLLYEVNLMTEPELLHSVERELFALRFLPIFGTSISNQLKKYAEIYVLSNDEIFNFLKANIADCNFVRAYSHVLHGEIFEKYAIIDYQYGSILRKKILDNKEQYVISLYTLVEREAFNRLINYCNNKSLNLRMLRIPSYASIKTLSNHEAEVVQYDKGFLELICDEDYLTDFCKNAKDKTFIMKRGASRSVRYDNGIWVTQGDCNEYGITVKDGIRCNNQVETTQLNTVHFFGPCIVFGMLVTNENTISEQYKNACIKIGREIAVENHGGLHGNHVLNSIIGALATPTKPHDSVVIIDYFDDLPKEEYISVEDYGSIFDKKTGKDTWFLDHPVHCNAEANRIIAEYLCGSIPVINKDKISYEPKSIECDNQVCASRFFTISNAVGVKTKSELRKLIIKKWGLADNNITILVVFDIENIDSFKSIINSLLEKENRILLLYAFDHLSFEKQIKYISVCSEYGHNCDILVYQLNPYFNISNYGDGKLYGTAKNLVNVIEYFRCSVLAPNEIKRCYLIKKQIEGTHPEYLKNIEGSDIQMGCSINIIEGDV